MPSVIEEDELDTGEDNTGRKQAQKQPVSNQVEEKKVAVKPAKAERKQIN